MKVCRTFANYCCPCFLENPVNKKVSKGILALDAEGDMYPDDFIYKHQPDFTEEEEFAASKQINLSKS